MGRQRQQPKTEFFHSVSTFNSPFQNFSYFDFDFGLTSKTGIIWKFQPLHNLKV